MDFERVIFRWYVRWIATKLSMISCLNSSLDGVMERIMLSRFLLCLMMARLSACLIAPKTASRKRASLSVMVSLSMYECYFLYFLFILLINFLIGGIFTSSSIERLGVDAPLARAGNGIPVTSSWRATSSSYVRKIFNVTKNVNINIT